MEPQVIDATRLRLRPHRADDVPAIVEQCSDPEMQRWTTVPSPYTRTHAEQFLDLVATGWRDERMLAFALADPATDEFLGTIDLRLDGAGAAGVGYGLHPRARGRGLMTVVLRELQLGLGKPQQRTVTKPAVAVATCENSVTSE